VSVCLFISRDVLALSPSLRFCRITASLWATNRTVTSLSDNAVELVKPAVTSLVPYREQSTGEAVAAVPKRSGALGKLDNGAEFVLAKLDDLVNWARRVGN
jgi:hypothetical protein